MQRTVRMVPGTRLDINYNRQLTVAIITTSDKLHINLKFNIGNSKYTMFHDRVCDIR